jgi:hypothetical protein
MEATALLIIDANLTEKDKFIRFYHPFQDLKKVCTLVDIYYDGNRIEDKYFFLENQDIRNNTFDYPIAENKKLVKVRVKKQSPNYDLTRLSVTII